jgi:ribosome-binding factor A
MSDRTEKVANRIKELAALYWNRANNRASLITVTTCRVSTDLKQATLYVTIFPVDKENAAMSFLKRTRGDLRDYLKKNLDIKNIPFLDVILDEGEKNRQKIDELLRNR